MEEKRNLGPDLVRETEEKAKLICERLKAASDRQESYADLRRRDIKYQVGNKVFLYRSVPSHDVTVEEIKVRSDLSYEEELVAILDREVKLLHSQTVLLVKFLWRNHKTKEAT
ncbi:uncharacterized protein LOC108458875 [Gossypium arboreum]|uniref:uncharacterized protein LOC108458875 n=1 Tax=Gossypium arboreum TaxID=29729 RepID=UPI000818FB95|nr:uncharacterized protein LOC108458875 [Gossypium arboreum]